MANSKITITLDQSIVDAFIRLSDSVGRMCDALDHLAPALKDGIPPAERCSEATSDATGPEMPGPTIPPEPSVQVPAIPEPAAPAFVLPTAQMNPVAPQVNPVQAIPVQAVPVAPAPIQMPTQAQEVTMERLAVAGAELMQRGVNALTVLAEFGVKAVSELPKEQYGAFALRLRQLGANI